MFNPVFSHPARCVLLDPAALQAVTIAAANLSRAYHATFLRAPWAGTKGGGGSLISADERNCYSNFDYKCVVFLKSIVRAH